MNRLLIYFQIILVSTSALCQEKNESEKNGGMMQVASLNTLDDLRDGTIHNLGFKSVWTRGYYAAGDNGGGTYTWSDTSTHADDGGGYIKPNSSRGRGRWVLQPSNGVVNIRQFGARNEYVNPGNSGYDNRQSIINALDFCNGFTASGYNYSRYKLYIPALGQLKFYFVSDSIVVSTSIEMYGDPGDFSSGLMFLSGKPGLIFPYPGSSSHITGVHGCYIHDLRIMSHARGILLRGRANGLTVRSANKFERLYIAGFPNNGVAIMGTAPAGNTNNSYFQSVASTGNFGNGFFIDGADANNITFLICDASSNGGWGFWDSSFLGCNFFGCHTAENGLIYTQVSHNGKRYQAIDSSGSLVRAGAVEPGGSQKWQSYWLLQNDGGTSEFYPDWNRSGTYYPGGSYFLDNANQLGAVVSSYTEGGQPLSRNLGGSMFMNGFAALSRPAHYMVECSYGTEFDRIAGKPVDGMHVFINQVGYKSVFGIADDVHGYNLGWQGDSTNKLLTTQQSNSPGPIKLFSNNTSPAFLGRSKPVGPGSMGTSDFFYFKSSTGYKRFSFSNAPPSSGAWEVGDFILNDSPATGAALGWRCTSAGSPGTWEAVAGIPSSPSSTQAGNGATTARILPGSANLDFPNTASQTDADLTIAVKGAMPGDEINLGVPPSAIITGGSYSAWVSSSNTATIRFSNYSKTSRDPARGIFKVSVVKR